MKNQLVALTLLTACCAPSVLAEETKELTMDGEFGLILTTGNTETTSASAGLKIKQEYLMSSILFKIVCLMNDCFFSIN